MWFQLRLGWLTNWREPLTLLIYQIPPSVHSCLFTSSRLCVSGSVHPPFNVFIQRRKRREEWRGGGGGRCCLWFYDYMLRHSSDHNVCHCTLIVCHCVLICVNVLFYSSSCFPYITLIFIHPAYASQNSLKRSDWTELIHLFCNWSKVCGPALHSNELKLTSINVLYVYRLLFCSIKLPKLNSLQQKWTLKVIHSEIFIFYH